MNRPVDPTQPLLPLPRAWASFSGLSLSKSTIELRIGRDLILFYRSLPIAIIHPSINPDRTDGGMLFYPDQANPSAVTRERDKFASRHGATALIRTSASNFDYILAQTLICTALPWTKPGEVKP